MLYTAGFRKAARVEGGREEGREEGNCRKYTEPCDWRELRTLGKDGKDGQDPQPQMTFCACAICGSLHSIQPKKKADYKTESTHHWDGKTWLEKGSRLPEEEPHIQDSWEGMKRVKQAVPPPVRRSVTPCLAVYSMLTLLLNQVFALFTQGLKLEAEPKEKPRSSFQNTLALKHLKTIVDTRWAF